MKSIRLLGIILLISSLPLISSAPSANSLSSATAAGSPINSKRSTEKPWLVPTPWSPYAIAFSPNGNHVAITHCLEDRMSIYNVDENTGVFTQVPGSPFLTGRNPGSVAFSADGKLVAVTNGMGVSIYTMNENTGTFTQVDSPSFKTEFLSHSVALCPKGKLGVISNFVENKMRVYTVDSNTGIFTEMPNSSFAIDSSCDIIFSPNGKLAVTSSAGTLKKNVYKVDADNGQFTRGKGMPSINATPYSVAFSPNGKLAATTFRNSDKIGICIVDEEEGSFTPIQGSPFKTDTCSGSVTFSPEGQLVTVMTGEYPRQVSVYKIDESGRIGESVPFILDIQPYSIAFSPVSAVAAVASYIEEAIGIYEVDEQTGKFTPITGGLLQAVAQRLKKTKELFTQFGQEKHPTQEGQLAGFGSQTPNIDLLISAYLVGSTDKPSSAASVKESVEEKTLRQALAQTQKERLQANDNKPLLFTAIQNSDLKSVAENLTPFTINSLNEQRRTPLMEAVLNGTEQNNQNKDLIKLLLEYQGLQQDDEYHRQITRVNTQLCDANGDTALMLAIKQKQFGIALLIATVMKPEEFTIKNQKQETVADLLRDTLKDYANDQNYETLVALTSKK